MVFRILKTFICIVTTVCAYTYTDVTNLHSNLTSGYESSVRPDESTVIGLSFGLMSISYLDIVEQKFSLTGFLIANWQDSRLTWISSSYGNISQTMIKFSKIWTPSLLINNAADGIRIINDDSDLASIYLNVNELGQVYWMAPVNVNTQCSVNIESYPFDSQTCDIIISSWLFPVADIEFYSSLDGINQDLYIENGEWDITSTSVTNSTRTLLGYPLSVVTFTANLQRKYSYYVITMLLPVTILSLLAPFVFLLPIDSGEQNGYSLTVMLSLSVVMTLVAESIPPTATHVSILSVYLLVTFILCSVQTLLAVLMTRYHNYASKGYKLGSKTNRATHFMAKATFYRRSEDQNDDKKTESTTALVDVVNKDLRKCSTPVAWNKGMEKSAEGGSVRETDQEEMIYSYEEFVHVFNNLNFVIFFGFTCIITLIFMLLLTC